MKRNELKQKYYKETFCYYKDSNGLINKEYMNWIEEALIKQFSLNGVISSNNVDYKQAFELALKYINSKPLKVDATIKELTAWDNLTKFIDKHNLY